MQEVRVSRQLMSGETIDQDLTHHPYVPYHGEIFVYCFVPSSWGDVGTYINNLTNREQRVFDLLHPEGTSIS